MMMNESVLQKLASRPVSKEEDDDAPFASSHATISLAKELVAEIDRRKKAEVALVEEKRLVKQLRATVDAAPKWATVQAENKEAVEEVQGLLRSAKEECARLTATLAAEKKGFDKMLRVEKDERAAVEKRYAELMNKPAIVIPEYKATDLSPLTKSLIEIQARLNKPVEKKAEKVSKEIVFDIKRDGAGKAFQLVAKL